MKVSPRFFFASMLALLIGLAPLVTEASYAQTKKGKSAEATGQKSRGEGKNENIKSKSEANDPKALPEAPVEKGGKKTRSGYTTVTFENYTAYKI